MNEVLYSILVFLCAKGVVVASTSQSLQGNVQTQYSLKQGSVLDNKSKSKFDFANILEQSFDGSKIASKMVSQESAKFSHRQDLKQGKRALKDSIHEVVIAVKQSNLQELEVLVNDISDPKSVNFGKHLSKKEVTKMTSNPDSARHVVTYLKQSGATVVKRSKYQDFITARAPVSVWEELMATQFYEFEHVDNKQLKVVRALHYSLPDNLADHVATVFNTVQFPDEFAMKKKVHTLPAGRTARPHVKSDSNSLLIPGYVTPLLLNNFYNITSNTGSSMASQCVYEGLNQTYSPSDLTTFQNDFQLPLEPVAVDIGGHADNNACTLREGGFDHCGEANLDVQYMMAVSQVTPTTYWYTDEDNFMLEWVTQMADMENPPLVNSISYSSYEIGMTAGDAETFNVEAMKLAAMGVTLISASGDDGVAGSAAREKTIMCGYYPQFPASSPYVTAVGGTMGPEANPPTDEVVCTSDNKGVITSGGGFSGLYPRPAWQTTQVQSYFDLVSNTNNAPMKGYQTQGRGYPDVSLLAAYYDVVFAGQLAAVFGTSASTPVFAAFVSLVNAKRKEAGKSSLGWINPSLYALSDQFILNDITSGKNNCVADEDACCEQGFNAAIGWDPASGLGSVNYGKFEEVFFALGSIPSAGEPTGSPNLAPTQAPTSTVTVAPTAAAGWIYVQDFPNGNANGTAATVVGVATGQCSITYGSSGLPNGSVKYSCGEVFATVYRYTDHNCQLYLRGHNYFLGVATDVSNDQVTNTYSQTLQCSAGSTIPLPLTANYALQSQYNNEECASPIFAFEALQTGHCFNYLGISSQIEYPVRNVYTGDNCNGKNLWQSITFSETCAESGFEPQQDDFYGNTYGTNVQSASFTYISSASNYQFTVVQTLTGISSTTYSNNLNANNAAVVAAAAASMTGITTQNIVITTVAAAPNAVALRRKLQSTTDTSVTYTVNYDYIALGYSSATDAYNALVLDLNTAVSDTSFTTSLQNYATANGITTLNGVTAGTAPTVSAASTLQVTDDPVDTSDDSSDNTVAIAVGSTFGVIGFLLLCGGVIYCCTRPKYGQDDRKSEVSMAQSTYNNSTPVVQAHVVQAGNPIHQSPIHKQ